MIECKKSTLIIELEDKIKNVTDAHESQVKRLTEIKKSLGELKFEEEKVVLQLSLLAGSFSAYQDSLKSINALDNVTSKE